MSPMKTLAKSVSALALGLTVAAGSALADDSQLSGVTDINISLSAIPELTVRNVAANHQLSNLQLAVQENQVSVAVGGYVQCTGTQFENWVYREGHFLQGGAFGIGRTSLLLSKNLPSSSNIDHTSDIDAHAFQMPIALLANPQIDIDPVAIVLAAADKAPSKIDYLRQDHVITVKFPIRWEADCAYFLRRKVAKETIIESQQDGPSYLTKDVELKIKYKGDPQLSQINAQLAQGGGLPNQVQAGHQPLDITQMTFQPNMPHHTGACPATTKIRVFYKGQGKGQLRIRINDSGLTIHNSPVIAFDSKNGQQHYDFEIETPAASKSDLNKTVNHNLQVYVRAKDEKAASWPAHYQPMDADLWRHRCTPQMNPALGGGPVGGIKQGGAAAPSPVIKPLRAPVEPAPAKPKRAN